MNHDSDSGYLPQAAGHRLYWRRFQATQPRAQLLLVHGIGEHSGRYEDIIPHFLRMGLNVFAYDQYGHGRSEGRRGDLDTPQRLVEDLRSMRQELRRLAPDLPLILFGHSMGGAVVADYLVQYQGGEEAPDYAVLSSPALKTHMTVLSKLGSRALQALAPHLVITHHLSMKVSHRDEINAQLKNDPLCHKKISGSLSGFILAAGEAARAHAQDWQVPTLLLYAGADFLVDAKGSAEFARKSPPLVQAHCFEGYYHEIFHEINPEPVYARLAVWLDDMVGKAEK